MAKHYIGDGGTRRGIDQGVTLLYAGRPLYVNDLANKSDAFTGGLSGKETQVDTKPPPEPADPTPVGPL